MTAGDISVSSTHRHSHPHNISHAHNSARHLSGSSTQTTAMAHHHHHQHHQRSSAQSHEYLEASQSPVPSLTSATLRSSSVSSSVNSLSPDAHQATTPRDLLPQFQSVSNACHASIDSVADSVGADGTEFKKRRRDEEEEEKKEEVVVRSGGDSRSAPLPLPQQQQYQQQPESKKRRTTRRLVTGERRPLTGSTDFVKLFGLSGLYDEFVRPYIVDGQVRRTLPDLAASDYLRGVNGAVAHGTAAVDLVGLVKAPPKSQFSKLDPLPMTSIRAAFAIGNDEKTKKPVVKHQGTSEQSKSQQSRQSTSGDHRHRSQQSSTPASQPKAARY